nr:NAD(P)-binding domain-containing protein [Actinomycetota bacterium]
MSARPFPPGEYPVVVVGSGAGGIQLSYDLRRLGVRHALLDEQPGPGGMFRRFPLFHRLNTSSRREAIVDRESPHFYRYDWNSLVSADPSHRALVPEFMDGTHYFPTRREMEQAIVTFAERSRLEIRHDCRWESTRAEDDGFVVGTTDGEYRCRFLVLATGMAQPWKPPTTPGIELVPHYDDLLGRTEESFEGRRIFVIGKRNSAFEIADSLLSRASQIILGSPHPVRPSILTGIPSAPRARYLEVYEDALLGGGSFVVDCAIERIERSGDGWRVHAEGTTNPGPLLFEVDEVIAATGFGTPLGDLRDLGLQTFYKDRLAAQTPFWESISLPGVFFAGAATQGQVGMRKHGIPTGSASVGGFRFNAQVQARELARRLGIEIERSVLDPATLVDFLLERATFSGALWRQPVHLAQMVSFDRDHGIIDDGILPLTPFVDSPGQDAIALAVETDPDRNQQPVAYVRREGRVREHILGPAFLHDFRTQEHRDHLASLLKELAPQAVS